MTRVGCRDGLSGGTREPLKTLEEENDQAGLAAVTEWTRGLEAQRRWRGPPGSVLSSGGASSARLGLGAR